MIRRIEVVSGLLVGVLGLLGLGYAYSGPLGYQSATTEIRADGTRIDTYTSGTTTLAQQGLPPRAVAFLALMALCVVGAAVGASLHSRFGGKGALLLLHLSALLLFGLAIATGFSIGMFLAPAALLALLTAVLATIAEARITAAG